MLKEQIAVIWTKPETAGLYPARKRYGGRQRQGRTFGRVESAPARRSAATIRGGAQPGELPRLLDPAGDGDRRLQGAGRPRERLILPMYC